MTPPKPEIPDHLLTEPLEYLQADHFRQRVVLGGC
jgi:hypothetical protein